MQVSLHSKKFEEIPRLFPYLLTDFVDIKRAISPTETAVQRVWCRLSPSKPVQSVRANMAGRFPGASSAERNVSFV